MIIAWLFCASTGIIIARHFKFLFPTKKICDLKIWFVVHRPLMILVAVISIVAFIVILAYKEWSWLDTEDAVAFTHSIFGIVTIGLAVLQVICCLKLSGLVIKFFLILVFLSRYFSHSSDVIQDTRSVLFSTIFTEPLAFPRFSALVRISLLKICVFIIGSSICYLLFIVESRVNFPWREHQRDQHGKHWLAALHRLDHLVGHPDTCLGNFEYYLYGTEEQR